jgi:ATPase subunit of ABC transporter with duplicated ATPase domains
MAQRLALCRALLHEPLLVLLDEPYSALDRDGATLLDRELRERRGDATFVVTTHDRTRLDPLASAAVVLG